MNDPRFPPVGARVRIARGISDTEKALAAHPERRYIVERYTRPHGFAVIHEIFDRPGFDAGSWHVHPEALEVEP